MADLHSGEMRSSFRTVMDFQSNPFFLVGMTSAGVGPFLDGIVLRDFRTRAVPSCRTFCAHRVSASARAYVSGLLFAPSSR